MIRAALLLVVAVTLAACQQPSLTGIAAGVGREMAPPRAPLADPADATFAFLPFPGIPGNVSDALLRRIWLRAGQEGLTVIKRPGGPALFTVEGSLTATSNETNSLIFYVFDVKDISGRRLHRIVGEQRSEESGGDPWDNVNRDDLDLIAIRLSALINAWLNAGA
ncbi:hypothetical protein RDV64_05650 [Acuticoccus sp. MNP-M23]|uniref:hypothetical protein n=1 Tax=Acuticoccus sp. MNP-M23 TaxID=3072793 RepID=UPI0028164ADA|nr:hypothetical protein [Acuticoccus sp. MNP-M23]WMS43877.1 hypothetical protein RDV64_05650 [Acuticoccus sp. MNP-M23]